MAIIKNLIGHTPKSCAEVVELFNLRSSRYSVSSLTTRDPVDVVKENLQTIVAKCGNDESALLREFEALGELELGELLVSGSLMPTAIIAHKRRQVNAGTQ